MNTKSLHLLIALCIASAAVVGPAVAAPEDPTSTIEFEGETLTLETAPVQTVGGTSNLDGGTELVIEIQSVGDEKYNEIERATVDADGTFETTFDLSRTPETGFVLTVMARNESDAWVAINSELRGEIVAPQASATIDHEGDTLRVEPSADATITGEASLDAGRELTIRVRSSGDAEASFLTSRQVTVSEDGTFGASFDLGDVPTGTDITVSVMSNASKLASVDGTVVARTTTTSTTTITTEEDTSTLGQPGFGIVVALPALVAAALVAIRRS